MAVNPMLSSGTAAMEKSLSQLDEAAHKLTSAGAPQAASKDGDSAGVNAGAKFATSSTPSGSPDQAEALASVTVYARQVQAAAKVVETADATVGFLLDIHA